MKRGFGKKKNTTEILYNLNSYEDIFSDFDPRPSSQRSISEDFIAEAKKVIMDHERSDGITLQILLPKKSRRIKEEETIIKRLQNHFSTHHYILKERLRSAFKEGGAYTTLGVVFMLLAAYIVHTTQVERFLLTFLIIILEPAGWFLFWEGLYIIIFDRRKQQPDIAFYEKLARSKIVFSSKK